MHSNKILNYFTVSASFFCVVHVIAIHNKTSVFEGFAPTPSRSLLDPMFLACPLHDLEALRTLPQNHWLTEKPLFAALLSPAFPTIWRLLNVVIPFSEAALEKGFSKTNLIMPKKSCFLDSINLDVLIQILLWKK